MAIRKQLRFEVFKRDEFCCRYCGRRPPDVVLEIDHIEPKVAGGADEELNLVTSCFECNRGKAGKRLGDIRPYPDADLKYLECQQEIVEAKRYLVASLELAEARKLIRKRLADVWNEFITAYHAPTDHQWNRWLATFNPDEVEYAIKAMATKFNSGGFDGSYREQVMAAVRYASAIMRNRKLSTTHTESALQ